MSQRKIKVRKKDFINTTEKIHTPKPKKKEKHKWDWRKDVDIEDLINLGIEEF